jgi:hypothetical protein
LLHDTTIGIFDQLTAEFLSSTQQQQSPDTTENYKQLLQGHSMAGKEPAVSAGHSRKGVYVLLAWALLLQCAFTGLQWQWLFPKQHNHQEQQQPAAPASQTDKFYKPMAGELCKFSSCCSCNWL